METVVRYTGLVSIFVVLIPLHSSSVAENSDVGLEINCGEAKVLITVRRQFFEDRHVLFRPEFLRLGSNSASCKPTTTASQSQMLISAGLRECGAESRVDGKWLVYSNQLILVPAVVATATGTVVVRGATAIIPVECRYEIEWAVSGQPLTPTWMPMVSTISSFGLLHFSIRTMSDGCAAPRASSVYQQGEAVFLEASVEAPLHPPLTVYVDYCVATVKSDPVSLPSYKFVNKHGCLMDSVLPDSSSSFLPRNRDNRLCFSVQAFRFAREFGEQMFITCHLKATLKLKSKNHLNKACFFHKPTFSWRSTEGDSALCECCDTDCVRQTGKENITHTGYTAHSEAETQHEADSTVGPFRTLPPFHWTGHLSVSHKGDFFQLNS